MGYIPLAGEYGGKTRYHREFIISLIWPRLSASVSEALPEIIPSMFFGKKDDRVGRIGWLLWMNGRGYQEKLCPPFFFLPPLYLFINRILLEFSKLPPNLV